MAVKPKARRWHTVQLGQTALDIVRVQPRRGLFVFCHKDGRRFPKAPKGYWKARLAELGIARPPMHALRHTFASALLNAGYSLDHVGALLGHAAPAITARYAHMADNVRRRAAGGSSGDEAAHDRPLRLRACAHADR